MSGDSFSLVDYDDEEDQQNIDEWLSDFQNDVNDDDDNTEENTDGTKCNSRDSLESDKEINNDLEIFHSTECDLECLNHNQHIAEINDLHLNYGAHIASIKPSHHISAENFIDKNFLPYFNPRKGILLSEPDTYKLVIEALLGFSNDIFELSCPQQQFNLSYIAQHVYLRETSSSSLQMLLRWFTSLATNIHVCRVFAYGNSKSQSDPRGVNIILPYITKYREQSYDDVGHDSPVYKALRSTTIDLMGSIEAQLCSLDAAVSIVPKVNMVNSSTEYTLIALYAICRSWVPLFKSISALLMTLLHPVPLSTSSPIDNEREWVKNDGFSTNLTPKLDFEIENENEDIFSGAHSKKIDKAWDISYCNTITKEMIINKQKQELWTTLQCSGIMQGLFAMQRWRRLTVTLDPYLAFQSSRYVATAGTIPMYSEPILISKDTGTVASIGSKDTSIDEQFSSHLYSTGVLQAVEIKSFIKLLHKDKKLLCDYFICSMPVQEIGAQVYGAIAEAGARTIDPDKLSVRQYDTGNLYLGKGKSFNNDDFSQSLSIEAAIDSNLERDKEIFKQLDEKSHFQLQHFNDFDALQPSQKKRFLESQSQIIQRMSLPLTKLNFELNKRESDFREDLERMIIDLMPLGTQLEIIVAVPLHQSLASELFSALTVLKDECSLTQHIKFLTDVFFLGNFITFEPLKIQEQEFDIEEGHQNFRLGKPYKGSSSAEASILCDKMTNHLVQMIPTSFPQGISFAAVTVSLASTTSGLSSSAIDNSNSGNIDHSYSFRSSSATRGALAPPPSLVQEIVSAISIELVYTKPLSEMITPDSLMVYNSILRFILQLSAVRWTADSAWMQCMRSNLLSARRRVRKSGNINSNGDDISILSDSSNVILELTKAKCRAGMGLVIHTLSTLQSHYMGYIHGHILPQYCKSSSFSQQFSSSPQSSHHEPMGNNPVGDDGNYAKNSTEKSRMSLWDSNNKEGGREVSPCLFDLCSSVPQLRHHHKVMLSSIESCLSLCKFQVLDVLNAAFVAASEIRSTLRKGKTEMALDMIRNGSKNAKLDMPRSLSDVNDGVQLTQAVLAFEAFRRTVSGLTQSLAEIVHKEDGVGKYGAMELLASLETWDKK